MEDSMRASILTAFLILLISVATAQEGPAYANTNRVLETKYQVTQKHGKNVMRIASKSVGYYDSTGTIVTKSIYKGNMTYMGKALVNHNDKIREELRYNYMNLLNSRIVTIKGDKKGEITEIEYDTKGKILHKTNYRIHDETGNLWQTDYDQLGYASSYDQLIDEDGKLVSRIKYNYFDDIIERHFYLYNDKDLLTEIYAISNSDSLIYRTINTYDEKWNLAEERFYDRWENNYQSYRYYYDEHNRLIQQSKFDWDPKFGAMPLLRQQSDYEYY